MKKILQRIGLLAVTGMLLWGYQGMEANAAQEQLTVPENSHIEAHYSRYDSGSDYIGVQAEKYYVFPGVGGGKTEQLPVVQIRRNNGTVETMQPGYSYSYKADKKDENGNKWTEYYVSYEVKDKLQSGETVTITGNAELMQFEVKAYDDPKLARNDEDNTFRMVLDANYWLYSHPSDIGYAFTDMSGNPVDYFQAGIDFNADYNDELTDGQFLFYVKLKDYSAPNGTYTLTATDPYSQNIPKSMTFEVVDKIEKKSDTTPGSSSEDEEAVDLYKIIDGTKSTWNGSTTEGLTIRGDGDFAKFAGVRVDGNWIPSAHYEAKAGSTIVTLKPSYLASLSEGEHTVDIMWIDDSASTTFTVAANTAAAQAELDSVPKTGEGVMGWMPEISLLVAAGLTIMGALRLKKAK